MLPFAGIVSGHSQPREPETEMDIVYISDLKIETVIGIFDWERQVKQTVTLNLEMAADIAGAARSDSITDALDYKAISKRLLDFVSNSHFQLVETLAERTCELLLTEFKVSWVRLKLGKPGAVTHAADVGVIIERGARG